MSWQISVSVKKTPTHSWLAQHLSVFLPHSLRTHLFVNFEGFWEVHIPLPTYIPTHLPTYPITPTSIHPFAYTSHFFISLFHLSLFHLSLFHLSLFHLSLFHLTFPSPPYSFLTFFSLLSHSLPTSQRTPATSLALFFLRANCV